MEPSRSWLKILHGRRPNLFINQGRKFADYRISNTLYPIHRHDMESSTPTHILSFQDEEEYVYLDIACDIDGADQGSDDTDILCVLIGTCGFEASPAFHRS